MDLYIILISSDSLYSSQENTNDHKHLLDYGYEYFLHSAYTSSLSQSQTQVFRSCPCHLSGKGLLQFVHLNTLLLSCSISKCRQCFWKLSLALMLLAFCASVNFFFIISPLTPQTSTYSHSVDSQSASQKDSPLTIKALQPLHLFCFILSFLALRRD